MATAIHSIDGQYLAVEQDDGNFVIYLAASMTPLWDRWSFEDAAPPAVHPPPPLPSPIPPPPPPVVTNPPPGGGGLSETSSSTAIRPRLTAADIRRFLPDRGPFRFPAPYNTRGVRVTTASDGAVRPVGMAYWPVLNHSRGRAELLLFVSLDDTLTLFSIDKASLTVQREGALPFHTTGEFCYWSFTDPDLLYVPDGTRLFQYNVRSHQISVAVDAPSEITQCHSSADGRAHSLTLDGSAAVFRNGRLERFPRHGQYDECQIDKSGRWLLIKEDADNRVVDLNTGREFLIANAAGAVGHSDMGWGYMVGEDDQTDPGGVFRLWLFGENGPINGGVMYATNWTGMTRYVSHCNAIQSRPENHDVLFSSSHAGDQPRANELVICRLDGTGRCTVVCPSLTDLTASGGGEEYWRKTRACLDPTGRYAAWSGNCGTDRLDVFVVELP